MRLAWTRLSVIARSMRTWRMKGGLKRARRSFLVCVRRDTVCRSYIWRVAESSLALAWLRISSILQLVWQSSSETLPCPEGSESFVLSDGHFENEGHLLKVARRGRLTERIGVGVVPEELTLPRRPRLARLRDARRPVCEEGLVEHLQRGAGVRDVRWLVGAAAYVTHRVLVSLSLTRLLPAPYPAY